MYDRVDKTQTLDIHLQSVQSLTHLQETTTVQIQ